LDAAAAEPVMLGPLELVQAEETEVLVHLLALLEQLLIMQAAAAGLAM
jgi:hypothetical protein